jgi:hypothetical protein
MTRVAAAAAMHKDTGLAHRLTDVVLAMHAIGCDIRKAVNERNLDLVRSVLATQAGRDSVNLQGSDGWIVLQRACVHTQDVAHLPNSTFGRKWLPTSAAFEPAPWVQTFGRALLEATQGAEDARKSTERRRQSLMLVTHVWQQAHQPCQSSPSTSGLTRMCHRLASCNCTQSR